jgi:hypothetical protein
LLPGWGSLVGDRFKNVAIPGCGVEEDLSFLYTLLFASSLLNSPWRKMYWASFIASCALVAGVRAELLDIPWVDHVVSQALGDFADYITHNAPSSSAAAAVAAPTANAMNHDVLVAAASDPGYWLADISHQGYAPYSSSPSSYAVFRNVKDYGAAGRDPEMPPAQLAVTDNRIQAME